MQEENFGGNNKQDKALEHSESQGGVWDNFYISNLEEFLNDKTTCQANEYINRYWFMSQSFRYDFEEYKVQVTRDQQPTESTKSAVKGSKAGNQKELPSTKSNFASSLLSNLWNSALFLVLSSLILQNPVLIIPVKICIFSTTIFHNIYYSLLLH